MSQYWSGEPENVDKWINLIINKLGIYGQSDKNGIKRPKKLIK